MKGWFEIPGVQKGDRKLKDQLKGLQPALLQARGKTLLDLGCAEGLITREFLKAGVVRAKGVEIVFSHVETARRLCAGMPVDFVCNDAERFAQLHPHEEPPKYDIVLALAVLHKLKHPDKVIKYLTVVAADLFVVRTPATTPGCVLDARSGLRRYEITKVFEASGFKLEHIDKGHFDEWVGYFRRG